jgi:hypothetical protein
MKREWRVRISEAMGWEGTGSGGDGRLWDVRGTGEGMKQCGGMGGDEGRSVTMGRYGTG